MVGELNHRLGAGQRREGRDGIERIDRLQGISRVVAGVLVEPKHLVTGGPQCTAYLVEEFILGSRDGNFHVIATTPLPSCRT